MSNASDQHTPIPESLPDQEQFWRPPARFGSVPVEAEPMGWDRKRGFEKHYPRVNLPMQIIERVSLGKTEPHEPNRLIWGDNLHVMRQIESNSVDLIYMDPPFFSGRQYNVMWGDEQEMRSFNDIWQDGMPGYLIWLNARLFEMKRILKPTGSIYVHCDWHASHYIKVEMDKIFGYENFRNEIIWAYRTGGATKRSFGRKHDALLFYSKSKEYFFNTQLDRSYLTGQMGHVADKTFYDDEWGRYQVVVFSKTHIKLYRDSRGYFTLTNCRDYWNIDAVGRTSKERIGYPTQKPEALLERIIKASSNEDDIVFDPFIGGGTTAAVAQRLNRRWIAADQSRVAVSVTAERLKGQAMTREMDEGPAPDFNVEQWGIYESQRLSDMQSGEFREFVLHCYGATRHESAAPPPYFKRKFYYYWRFVYSIDYSRLAQPDSHLGRRTGTRIASHA